MLCCTSARKRVWSFSKHLEGSCFMIGLARLQQIITLIVVHVSASGEEPTSVSLDYSQHTVRTCLRMSRHMQDGECGEDVFAVSYLTCHLPLHSASDDAYPVAPATTKLSALSASHQLIRIVSPQNIKHVDIPTVRIGTEARNNADVEQERRERPLSKSYWLCSFQTILADCRRIMASLRTGAEWPAPRACHHPCIPVPSHWPDIR